MEEGASEGVLHIKFFFVLFCFLLGRCLRDREAD